MTEIKKPTKEELEDVYIGQNMSRDDMAVHFGVKVSMIKTLLAKHKISKPKELHVQNIEKSCLAKYGVKNAGWTKESQEKIKKTHIERYGEEWGAHKLESTKEKRKETCKEIYGHENVFQSSEIKAKSLDTIREKYGVNSYTQTEEYKQKSKETNLNLYGAEHYTQTDEYKERVKKTNIAKYGVEHVSQVEGHKEKAKQTNIERYGVDSYTKTEEYKEKSKRTNLEKYGVVYPTSLPEVKEKVKKTNLEKYGAEYYAQTPEGKEKRKQTCMDKYGVDNWTKTPEYKKRYEDKRYVNNILEKQFATRKKNGTLGTSNLEKEVIDFISLELGKTGGKFLKGWKDTRFEVDYLVGNIGIEVNGAYWHSTRTLSTKHQKHKQYHYNKMLNASELGIDLIQIWEDQWKNKQDIVKDILRARLGVLDTKLYARKCEVRNVDNKTYREFCEAAHIQGYRAATVRLGLYFEDRLVQVASFNKCHGYGKRQAQCEWEWIRGCIASNNMVIGGTSKLLKHFIRTSSPESILCYADANLFNGDGYLKAGFEFKGFTGADKFYIENNTFKRYARNPYKYREYKDLVEKGRLLECHGAGSRKFVWVKPNDVPVC